MAGETVTAHSIAREHGINLSEAGSTLALAKEIYQELLTARVAMMDWARCLGLPPVQLELAVGGRS